MKRDVKNGASQKLFSITPSSKTNNIFFKQRKTPLRNRMPKK